MDFQLELNLKSLDQVPGVVTAIMSHDVSAVTLVHKPGALPNLKVAEVLARQLPQVGLKVRLIPIYSIAENYGGSAANAQAELARYCSRLVGMGLDDLLLVSGNPPKKFTSTTALAGVENIQNLHLAYTPSRPGEKERFIEKLAAIGNSADDSTDDSPVISKSLSSVYIQITTDVTELRESIDWLRSVSEASIVPSVVLPTTEFLWKFEFRPWSGVKFGPGYLNHIDTARAQTEAVLDYCHEQGLTPVITASDLSLLEDYPLG